MKTLMTTFALLLSILVQAQFVPGDEARKRNSAITWQFAVDHVGQKIGNGVCYELPKAALKLTHKTDYESAMDHTYLYVINDVSKVIPGDIVIFYNVVWKDGDLGGTIKSHIGIVAEVLDGHILYYDQNHGALGDEKDENGAYKASVVDLHYIEFSFVKSGSIKFYRF
jgi:hypothetical protein